MRCIACDVLLSERELVAKNKRTGMFYDMCTDCMESYRAALNDLEEEPAVISTVNKEIFTL